MNDVGGTFSAKASIQGPDSPLKPLQISSPRGSDNANVVSIASSGHHDDVGGDLSGGRRLSHSSGSKEGVLSLRRPQRSASPQGASSRGASPAQHNAEPSSAASSPASPQRSRSSPTTVAGAAAGKGKAEASKLATLEARCRQLERSLAARDADHASKVRSLEEKCSRAARELERRERQVDDLVMQGQALKQRLKDSEPDSQATSDQSAELERKAQRQSSGGRGRNGSTGSPRGGRFEPADELTTSTASTLIPGSGALSTGLLRGIVSSPPSQLRQPQLSARSMTGRATGTSYDYVRAASPKLSTRR